jgi:hypothetical protein
VIRFRKGLGWVDAATDRCALPPDGNDFALALGYSPGARTFHVVELPLPLAVVSVSSQAPVSELERAQIEDLLADRVAHVAFLREDRPGACVVDGRGPPRLLATAAAALKAIGGWDESVPISITVNGEAIAVRLGFDGPEWIANAQEAST